MTPVRDGDQEREASPTGNRPTLNEAASQEIPRGASISLLGVLWIGMVKVGMRPPILIG